ncbi:NADH-quinone oxidoreductase subunit C [Proteiniphilum sp.]|uniref:NADH-quinone oxidoreductase subunit C n=1 Tax=Proteiniphilum sp. TaxID=1926877 RepID=UPI002B1F536F|nr:NADH-quinone oxidoreductase subunit C [Proteiniphilum sp.]MEA4918727.1 NADH-quinone oxidoreductase subunit C [Proteiniphilum sp.]
MALEIPTLQQRISERFPDTTSDFMIIQDIFTFTVKSQTCKELIDFLHSDEVLNFNFLTDLCGVHYPDNMPDKQFAVVYLLHNWVDNIRIRVKTFLPGNNPETDSVTSVFASANWMERETYDFYGIQFTGHPNLKRILNHDGMKVFPLRKEYPLEDEFRTDKDDRFFGREVNPNSIP